tara:strand:+ start:354 stop:749 length:396 start_codon:yes stop_codon:yes gene_type:complete
MSKSYKTLWKELSQNAIIPAIKNMKSSSGGKKNKKNSQRNKTNNKNKQFISEWISPIKNINRNLKKSNQKGGFIRGCSVQHFPCILERDLNQNAGRKKRKSKKRVNISKKTLQKGGFIRAGSTQFFPCNDE